MMDEVVLFADLYFDGGTNIKRVCTGINWYSKAADSVGVLRWDGRIIEEPSYTIEVGCSIWNTRTSTSIGDMVLDNEDGALLPWLQYSARDCLCVLRLGYRRGPYADLVTVQTCLIDAVGKDGQSIRITLRGLDTRLDRALQSVVYESSPESTLDGQPLPVALGQMRQVEPVLYDGNGPDYKCADVALTVDNVYAGGSVAIPPGIGQQWIYDADSVGFEMQVQPTARITADLDATRIIQADSLGGDGEFFDDANWTGDTPSGWTVTDTPTANDVTHREGVGARLVSNGAADVSLFSSAGIGSGNRWHLFVLRVAEVASGRVVITIGGTEVMEAQTAGEFVLVTKTASPFLRVRIPSAEAGDVTVASVYAHELATDSDSANLTEVVKLIAMRGGFALGELDTAQWPAAMDVAVGCFYKDQITCRDVLDDAMKAITGYYWVGPDGTLKCGRLENPSASEADIVLSSLNMTSEPNYRPDLAPGLSDSWGGGRNWSPYAETELAGITYPNRPPFMAEYRFTAKGTGVLAREYRHAVGAKPIGTFLYGQSDTQAEANRITGILTDPHGFWDVSVAFPNAIAAALLQPDDIAELASTQYFGDGFDGVQAAVKRISGRYRYNELDLTVWCNASGA